jgi:hypothetical protein
VRYFLKIALSKENKNEKGALSINAARAIGIVKQNVPHKCTNGWNSTEVLELLSITLRLGTREK